MQNSYSLPRVCNLDQLVWIFDLDNTLYSPAYKLFSQIERNIQAYIERLLRVSPEEARRIKKSFFLSYGTTLRGLMEEHRIDPLDYLDNVHRIDLSTLPPDPHLIAGLQSLPGRKVIFTNGSLKHAKNIVRHLGIELFFEGIFDIVASCYLPKPKIAPYYAMLEYFAIDPFCAVMIEDIPRNLEPAAKLGMTTLLVTGSEFGHAEERDASYVHHKTDDLGAWLSGAAGWLRTSFKAG